MKAEFYVSAILKDTLLPFIHEKYPHQEHRFMQDNDPKHVSWLARMFMEESSINWWRTPAKSPDLNPIENLWHELKENLLAKIKPKNLDELVTGITLFWATVNRAKCEQYIGHLRKVIPKLIEVKGEATGY